jgi:hypothetical protein
MYSIPTAGVLSSNKDGDPVRHHVNKSSSTLAPYPRVSCWTFYRPEQCPLEEGVFVLGIDPQVIMWLAVGPFTYPFLNI